MILVGIKNFNDKDLIQDRVFIVREKNLSVGKNGKPFLSATLADKSGRIDSKLWDNVDQLASLFEIGDLIKVKGIIQIYNQRKQLVLHKIENVTALYNKADYILETESVDAGALYIELLDFVAKIQNNYIQQICMDTLNDSEIKEKIKVAAAAKTVHHAHKGGLIKHIVSICKMMDFISFQYPALNKDFLIFGALFHDIGKLWELDMNSSHQTYYTEAGQLLGHMQLACELIDKKSSRIMGFPEELRILLKHIVLSHHGKIEYGSPKLPMFAEAMIVAMVDDLDSKIDQVLGFINQEKQSGERWSKYNEYFERYFLLEDYKGKW